MSQGESFGATREAAATSTTPARGSARLYAAAFGRYSAAVAYRYGLPARPDERARSTGSRVDADEHGTAVGDEIRWDIQDAMVRDVMTRDVVWVDAGTTFREMVDTLSMHSISALPVVDADHKVVGIVSESDLLAKVVTGGDPRARIKGGWRTRSVILRKSQADTAAGLMTSPAVTTEPATSVVQAARTAAAQSVRRMPVVDDSGVLVGIVTRSDLLCVFDRTDDDIRTHIIEDILREEFCINPLSVEVKVAHGVVTLIGELESQALVRPVVEAVRSTMGVVNVNSKLSYHGIDDPPTHVIGMTY